MAILCTTSGTTARPKLAMLTGRALIRHCESYLKADPRGPEDDYVSVLPLPWIMEQLYVLGWGLIARMRVNFVEEPETTMADFREIGPNFVLFAPRVWESLAADVRARVMDASPLKRGMFELGMRMGLGALKRGRRSAPGGRAAVPGAARPARLHQAPLGGDRRRGARARTPSASSRPWACRCASSTARPRRSAPTPSTGRTTSNQDTVGVAFNDRIETRIDQPDANGLGEIVARHPNMFSGYYGVAENPDLRDGWLHTGDAGYFDKNGHLVVIDRVKDLATTAGGDRFSPQYIENKLKFSPYVAEAVVLGDKRPHLAAMVCIRFPIVGKWAERQRIAFTTYTDLSAKPEVLELLRREVEGVNATLPEAQRIRDFILLYKELDADDEELTRTRKVRRGVINEKYGGIIEAIYRGERAIPVDTTIAFQDGTRQRIRTTLARREHAGRCRGGGARGAGGGVGGAW